MSLPHAREVAEEYYRDAETLYVAEGYSEDTIVNNMILQLMLMNHNLIIEDLAKGRIIEKVSRETLAAAKFAVIKRLRGVRG